MKYSVQDMMSMRRSIASMYPSGVSYYAKDRDADIERQLLTYMSNETTAEELAQAAAGEMERWVDMQQHIARIMKNDPH